MKMRRNLGSIAAAGTIALTGMVALSIVAFAPSEAQALSSERRIADLDKKYAIGRAASSGCIRMHNEDVVDLFERVHIGAPVYVVRNRLKQISKN